ncbi:potassium transporter Kup [Rhizobium rhizosphaerae]|uniref:Probable potassium transport system protein Kup n=1 Tax=Xaviernesmea rhizosphaerae TaxID=1672749 RepID=A0A1Q9AH14_9HYPH|nr:potassium transporter Kup [Xaviernesmea rhizosphaerae]OLP54523.1 potassium transporter Kup [Xaviernesmea rhizosphaerae]
MSSSASPSSSPAEGSTAHGAHEPAHGPQKLLGAALGSIGVVYGDIGTSPLYAFREALRPVAGDGLSRLEIIGLVSLVLWTLTIIVTLKYVLFLLRADNHGEGGTLSLLALLMKSRGRAVSFLFFTGVAGAALFIGDAMITPALSVLSAVEGLKLVAPHFEHYVVPISVIILVMIFAVQSQGTDRVSKFFGPITLVWFIAIALAGLSHIRDDIGILAAFNPAYAITFLLQSGPAGFVVLGAVFLTVTGAEALYADLGHFGRRPIQLAWIAVVFPSLALNYLGQGALVLKDPAAMDNPFFLLFPDWALLPAVLLATAATIIASQAVITGAFSLARQAINLGFLPRMAILHTSRVSTGQIYVPNVNSVLLFGVMLLVLMFGSSESLATAYGISVTGAMVVTTLLAFEFVRLRWHWPVWAAASLLVPLLLLELVFLGANLLKIHDGGYIPVMIAAGCVVLMWTWVRGTQLLRDKTRHTDIPLASFIKSIERESAHAPVAVPGTAIFLTSEPDSTPAALLHNIKHNHVLHAQNYILTIRTTNTPMVPIEHRVSASRLSDRFGLLEMRFGYMETPNVSQALGVFRKSGLKFDIMSTSFYLGRRKLVPDAKSGMPHWQDRLFIAMANAAIDPSDYFRLPTNRVVELGSHVII